MSTENVLAGRYEIERPLGSGGAGTTWLARDRQTGQRVTVKRMSTPLGPDSLGLIERETKLLSSIEHPQVPTFVDVFTEPFRMQRYLHVVLEYVEGEPLSEHLKHTRYEQDEVRGIVTDLLGIVAWLHRLAPPIIHRDIKPSNLIRRPDGSLALIDFGLAIDAVDKTFQHTMAVGTIGYQAPEQIAGDPRLSSDVYSIGVVALELLTRTGPRDLLTGQTLNWRRHAAHLDAAWHDWLEGALADDPSRRYPNAQAALAALHAPTAPRPQVTAPDALRVDGNPDEASFVFNVILALIAGGLLLFCGVGLFGLPDRQPSPQLPPPGPTPAQQYMDALSEPEFTAPSEECLAGNDSACLTAAEILGRPNVRGVVTPGTTSVRAGLLGRACLGRPGIAEACVERANLRSGSESPLKWWVEACVRDDTAACTQVVLAANHPGTRDALSVRGSLQTACGALLGIRTRDVMARCVLLQRMYARGIGGPERPEDAAVVAERLCPDAPDLTCLPQDIAALSL